MMIGRVREMSLGKEFNLKAKVLADRQIQKAGYRLAAVLNAIFG